MVSTLRRWTTSRTAQFKLSRAALSDSRHHQVAASQFAEIEHGKVRLSANACAAFLLEKVTGRMVG